MTRPPGDVSDPTVTFVDETPTPTPTPTPAPRNGERPAEPQFEWPRYGYTLDHRRTFAPPEPIRAPYRRVWRRKATALLEFPPVIARGTLFQLADDGWLVARAKATGKRRWRRKIGTLAVSSPAVDGRELYLTVLETPRGAGRALSVRMRDGRIRWSRPLPSRSESSP